ncbi:MAG: hypothetical protein MUC89_13305 [Acetobacteraceae bacterium]|jgi:hypothetical protein|nr:hypothetical protein [Acetobacteraceae bacterium]
MLKPKASSALGLALAGGLLAGCANEPLLQETVLGAPVSLWTAGASVASFAVLQRGLVDVAYSVVTGKDCSVIHIERRGEYCRTEPVAAPVPFCTRSLGDVDCWAVAEPYGPQRPVSDTPARAERTPRRWSLTPF